MNGWRIEWTSKDGQYIGEGERTFRHKKIVIQVAAEMNRLDPMFIYKVKPVERKQQEATK